MESALTKDLRRKLELVVVKAREIAEGAARTELERLSVGEKGPAAYLSDTERKLRNRLRAHGRQLGDRRKPDGAQAIELLASEVAYEHWHRMLFARFLAESNLLIYEDGVTPLSIRDCFDLAEEETGDRSQGWQYAAGFASKMLPQIFRVDSPAFELNLAPNDQKQLEDLLASLDQATFLASDALGWVYQYWQSKRKDEVNASEVKIGAQELPAVTQLFTEPYMVSFLLHNTLGGWLAAKKLTSADLNNAENEDYLRHKVEEYGARLDYLRFARKGDGSWMPAAGSFDGWPDEPADLRILDPCCGSGHFLVAAFQILVPIRMACDGLSIVEAIDAVLHQNIYGLELDQRCVELAAFALALSAWQYRGASGYRALPKMNLACSGLSISADKESWASLAGDDTSLKLALEQMHELFSDATVLGSLVDPGATLAKGSLFEVEWDDVGPLILAALEDRKNFETSALAIASEGLSRAAHILSNKFTLVVTNVPYLKSGYHSERLKRFCEARYPRSKYDLATVFMERCNSLLSKNGSLAIVTQQYWLFLKYYAGLREHLLREIELGFIARLGPNAFEAISGEVVNVCLQITHKRQPSSTHIFRGFELDSCRRIEEKTENLLVSKPLSAEQSRQSGNPDSRISFELSGDYSKLLSDVADFGKGSVSGDGGHYLRKFWEFNRPSEGRRFWLNSPRDGEIWSGREDIILWGEDGHNPEVEVGFRFHGQRVFGKCGIAIGKAGKLRFTPYKGEFFDDNVAVICPYDEKNLEALWSFCTSGDFAASVRKLDKKMSVTAGTFTQVALDTKILDNNNNGDEVRNPSSQDPCQWVFHGHPARSSEPLSVAVARLLGYRWPAELDAEMELAEEQRELVNRCDSLLALVDDDGIVCIPAVRGEQPADQRLETMLQAAYGDQWSLSVRDKLLESVGCKNKSLYFWLREKFFEQHCKLFQNRPFIWHIWDGLKDGFAALVNYHHLDRKNLERLIYTYLDDWIRTQKHDKLEGIDGAGVRLAAAEGLKRRLAQILEGEAPYDIFVRWKPLKEQPIGWKPDLNDGVRLNIRPFMSVEDVGKKGAGILRTKPNIHWKKDRGKDVPSAPWYKLGLQYGESEGARINDHHLSLAEKKAACDD